MPATSTAADSEKEWKGLKLTPIKENEDGTNNYNEFKAKSVLDLDAIGYWKYVDGPDYKPPVIPNLVRSYQVEGLDSRQQKVTVTVQGNEAAVAAAKQRAEDWLAMDKKAHALIVKAVPIEKLFVVTDCKSAHDAWIALKNEYEPANALTAITIKQQIIAYKCNPSDDPVNWRQVMVQLYQKLREADPVMMSDAEFAKHLVTLMTESESWRYCRDSLRDMVRKAEKMGHPLASAVVIRRLKEEEVEKKIAPSIVQINALVTGKRGGNGHEAVPGVYAVAGPSNQSQRKDIKVQQRQEKRPAPYNTQQRRSTTARSTPAATGRRVCENEYCETPIGHVKADCFSYGGGKAGKYPEGFKGRRDVHLAPEARIVFRRSRVIDSMNMGGNPNIKTENVGVAIAAPGDRYDGAENFTEDEEEQVRQVLQSVEDDFAFMMEVVDDDVEDEIGIDEEIVVNAVALNVEAVQDGTVNHDTGASRHIFHCRDLFHDYVQLEAPLNVHGFGANLSAQAIGKGQIVMQATYNGITRNFSISNVLHIPSARCNLISGSRIDKKGVSTHTSNGKITYLNGADVPFASGGVVKDLYKMDVVPVKPESPASSSDLIAAMTPSVTSLFGPDSESAEAKRADFIIV